LVLSFKTSARLYKVNDEQEDSVVVVVAGFPRDLSHTHAFIFVEIIAKLRELLRMLCEGVAEEERDCL
jgi:hypothetical protein